MTKRDDAARRAIWAQAEAMGVPAFLTPLWKERHTMTKTKTTLLAKEFPDFDVTTLPTIPVGFVDSSWHNDACPSFTKGDLHLFVDYADKTLSEWPDSPRYSLLRNVGSNATELCHSDNWSDILAAIEAAK